MATRKKTQPSNVFRGDLGIPEDLKAFLSPRQRVTLEGYLANFTIDQFSSQESIIRRRRSQRKYLIEDLVDLGRVLGLYWILEYRIAFPLRHDTTKEFTQGWMALKKSLWKEIQHEKCRWQTVKARHNRTARKG